MENNKFDKPTLIDNIYTFFNKNDLGPFNNASIRTLIDKINSLIKKSTYTYNIGYLGYDLFEIKECINTILIYLLKSTKGDEKNIMFKPSIYLQPLDFVNLNINDKHQQYYQLFHVGEKIKECNNVFANFKNNVLTKNKIIWNFRNITTNITPIIQFCKCESRYKEDEELEVNKNLIINGLKKLYVSKNKNPDILAKITEIENLWKQKNETGQTRILKQKLHELNIIAE